MVDVKRFYKTLLENGVCFFAGVPDSLLKDLCAYITDHTCKKNNIIAANEGVAIGLAAGHYMSTGHIPVVYMQNSGIGNAVNPLLSLMDEKVYQLPVLLLVGWRGEPGMKDEPQHRKQGEVTLALFEAMQIPFEILDMEGESAIKQVRGAIKCVQEKKSPLALIIKKDTFSTYKLRNETSNSYQLSREDALRLIIDDMEESDIVVSTTGKLSRELFEYRESLHQGHARDFLTVGSMGHSSSIALGIALEKTERTVYCLDGDGSLLMHMGSLGSIGDLAPERFRHIIFNNGVHESVGGQPTVAFKLDIPLIAQGCGYKKTFKAENKEEIQNALRQIRGMDGPVLLEIKVGINSRTNLGRPTTTPIENKDEFMKFLKC